MPTFTKTTGIKNAAVLVFAILLFSTCKKAGPSPSGDNSIKQFSFLTSNNPGIASINGKISNDSVTFAVKPTVNVTHLVPSITLPDNATISPADGVAQDFSKPVYYTVTAANGASKKYIVTIHSIDSTKKITSFVFTAADNNGITSDIAGNIQNDTILVALPQGVSTLSLVPTISYQGQSISPAGKQKQDFSGPQTYQVTAEDGSVKTYTVFAGSNAMVCFGDNAGYIYCINGLTGKLQWKYKTGGACNYTPCIYKGLVIEGSDDGTVYALDALTGEVKWMRKVQQQMTGTALVNGDIVYVPAIGFYALDAGTGAIKWQKDRNAYDKCTSPVIYNGVVYVNQTAGNMQAFNAANGNLIWRSGPDMAEFGNPVLTDSVIYAGEENGLFTARNIKSGDITWVCGIGFGATSLTINGPILYAERDSVIYAYNVITRQMVWREEQMHNSTLTVVDNMIYAADASKAYFSKTIHVIDAGTGSVTKSFTPTLPMTEYENISGRISTAEETLYLVSSQNAQGGNGIYYTGVYAVNRFNGTFKWAVKADGVIVNPPVVVFFDGSVSYPGNSGARN